MTVDMKFYDYDGKEQTIEQHIEDFPGWTKQRVIDGLIAMAIVSKMMESLHDIISDVHDNKITGFPEMAERMSAMYGKIEPLIQQRIREFGVGDDTIQ